jgi:hypothetical protein
MLPLISQARAHIRALVKNEGCQDIKNSLYDDEIIEQTVGQLGT